jgi:rhamnogalacturonyl hydrolase YesR
MGFLFAITTKANAQNTALYKIADDIIEQTVFNLPGKESDPQPGRYNAWMYQNFLIFEGMDALYEVSGNDNYGNYSKQNIDFFAGYQETFGDNLTVTPSGKNKWYTAPKQMWHCGMIAAYAERQSDNPTNEFLRGMAIFDAFLEGVPRFEDGTLVRNKSNLKSLGVQIDDIYMLSPYWCRKAKLLDDTYWLDRAIEESLRYHEYFWNEKDQLMKCLWLNKTKSTYGHYWGRGNGWYIMALTDLITFVPENHPKRQALLNNYSSFIKGIIRYQNADGLWHQLLNRPDSFTESSCSGMFTYCILKGVDEGWLNTSFVKYGNLGWKGLLTKVNENYQIKDVCPPTDMSEDVDYYLKRERVLHDQHGIGPFLLAGATFLKVNDE